MPCEPLTSESLASDPLTCDPIPCVSMPCDPKHSEFLTSDPQPSKLWPTVSSTPCNIICSNQEPNLDTESPQNVPPNKPVQKSEESHTMKSSKLKQVASVNKNKNAKSPKRGTITSMFDAIIKRKLSPEKENDTAQENPKSHRSDNHNA